MTETEQTDRRDYVQGLRELAAFVEMHPEIPLPWAGSQNAFVNDKADLAAIAKIVGGRWAKGVSPDFFFIRKEFAGGFSYEANIGRESVCKKVVTGTRIEPAQPEREVEIVEWICDEPLLTASA